MDAHNHDSPRPYLTAQSEYRFQTSYPMLRTTDQLVPTVQQDQLFHASTYSDWSVAYCYNLVNLTHPSVICHVGSYLCPYPMRWKTRWRHRVRQHSIFKSTLQTEKNSNHLSLVETVQSTTDRLGFRSWLWHLVLCACELVIQPLSTLLFSSEKWGSNTALINLFWWLDENKYMENTVNKA